jgi:putative flippase GtrA
MRFVRYVSVQVLAYGLDMGGFLLALKLTAAPLLANICGKLLAGVFAFFTHRSFTFRLAGHHRHHRQAVMYFALLAFNIPLSTTVLWLVLHLLSAYPVAAKFLADVVCVLLTYWLSKTYVFVSHHRKQSEVPPPEQPAP